MTFYAKWRWGDSGRGTALAGWICEKPGRRFILPGFFLSCRLCYFVSNMTIRYPMAAQKPRPKRRREKETLPEMR